MRSLGDNLRLRRVALVGPEKLLGWGMLREGFRYAVVGSFDRANVVAPIFGAAAVFVGMRAAGFQIASPTDVAGSIYLLLASLGVPWICIIVGRFIYWPWRELKSIRRTSPLEVFFDPHNHSFREWAENPEDTDSYYEKRGEFYLVEVVNHGYQTIHGVRLVYSYVGQTNHHNAFGTDKTRLTLDPNSRKMVKLFFQTLQDYIGEGEMGDPSPREIIVTATATDTLASKPLRLCFEPTGADENSYEPIYKVRIVSQS